MVEVITMPLMSHRQRVADRVEVVPGLYRVATSKALTQTGKKNALSLRKNLNISNTVRVDDFFDHTRTVRSGRPTLKLAFIFSDS